MSAHANHHHHQGGHSSHLGAQSEGHLAAAAQQGGGRLLDDLNSLLHFHDGVRDSNHVTNDMMDLQSLLSGAGISSDALGAVGDDPDYRKLAGFHEELFKRGASGHDLGAVRFACHAIINICSTPSKSRALGFRLKYYIYIIIYD